MIVKSHPLRKLCQFEGEPVPKGKSDCWNDIDETEFACKEKFRIMVNDKNYFGIYAFLTSYKNRLISCVSVEHIFLSAHLNIT